MKDIHLQIKPNVDLFAQMCSTHCIPHYYHGHSHHCRGIQLTFKVNGITTDFFIDLEACFSHFLIRNERGHIEIVITLFEDDDLPF